MYRKCKCDNLFSSKGSIPSIRISCSPLKIEFIKGSKGSEFSYLLPRSNDLSEVNGHQFDLPREIARHQPSVVKGFPRMSKEPMPATLRRHKAMGVAGVELIPSTPVRTCDFDRPKSFYS